MKNRPEFVQSKQMNSNKVFVFWDNSNIFISAREVAREKEGDQAGYQIRISFDRLLNLAKANRTMEFAYAVGSVPPELRSVWYRLEKSGIKVQLFERGSESKKEQAVDEALQVTMLRKAIDYNGTPGVAVMLTGDGHGFMDGVGFHADLDRMHKKGWKIEVLAWDHSCNPRMKIWAENVGVFVPLEDFYEEITYLSDDKTTIRKSKPLELKKRKI